MSRTERAGRRQRAKAGRFATPFGPLLRTEPRFSSSTLRRWLRTGPQTRCSPMKNSSSLWVCAIQSSGVRSPSWKGWVARLKRILPLIRRPWARICRDLYTRLRSSDPAPVWLVRQARDTRPRQRAGYCKDVLVLHPSLRLSLLARARRGLLLGIRSVDPAPAQNVRQARDMRLRPNASVCENCPDLPLRPQHWLPAGQGMDYSVSLR